MHIGLLGSTEERAEFGFVIVSLGQCLCDRAEVLAVSAPARLREQRAKHPPLKSLFGQRLCTINEQ